MSQNQQQLPLPPKDQFQDDQDEDDIIVQTQQQIPTSTDANPDQVINNEKKDGLNQVNNGQKRIVNWSYKWVKVDNVCSTLPPVYIKKWVRNVVVLNKFENKHIENGQNANEQMKYNFEHGKMQIEQVEYEESYSQGSKNVKNSELNNRKKVLNKGNNENVNNRNNGENLERLHVKTSKQKR